MKKILVSILTSLMCLSLFGVFGSSVNAQVSYTFSSLTSTLNAQWGLAWVADTVPGADQSYLTMGGNGMTLYGGLSPQVPNGLISSSGFLTGAAYDGKDFLLVGQHYSPAGGVTMYLYDPVASSLTDLTSLFDSSLSSDATLLETAWSGSVFYVLGLKNENTNLSPVLLFSYNSVSNVLTDLTPLLPSNFKTANTIAAQEILWTSNGLYVLLKGPTSNLFGVLKQNTFTDLSSLLPSTFTVPDTNGLVFNRFGYLLTWNGTRLFMAGQENSNIIALLDYNPSSNQVTDHSSLYAGFTGTPCSLVYSDGKLYLSGFTGSSGPILTALDNNLNVNDLTTFVPSSFGVIDTIAISSGNIFISGGTFNSVQYGLLTPSVPTYSLTFTESGLPPGASWSVTLNGGSSKSVTGNVVSFMVSSGTSNSYSVQGPITVGGFDFEPYPGAGTASVDGADVNVPIVYFTTMSNWAGYVAMSDVSSPQPVVTSVSGSWIVQSVTPTLSPRFSSQWIGIGGMTGSSSLLQIGTASDSIADQTIYYAWFELVRSIGGTLVPMPSVPLLNTVKPGDVIQAEISVDKTTNYWVISIDDLTENWHYSYVVVGFKPSMLSAEWIVENQMSGIAHFANFGVSDLGQAYTHVANTNYATIGSTTDKISKLCNFAVSMYDENQGILARPSTLTSDGASFTVTWCGEGTVVKPILIGILLSPANLLFTDPQGRSVGFDPSAGTAVSEIPGALYSGAGTEPQFVMIPDPLNGTYSITLAGTANGNYTLMIEYVTPIQTTIETFKGVISPQETKYYSALLSGTQQTTISWEYVFKDTIRGTMLKISTDDKQFQFTAPDKDFGVKHDPNMLVSKSTVAMCYSDKTMGLIAGMDQTLGFCTAVAWDKQTCKVYMLIYFLHPPRCWHSLVQ